MKKLIATTKLIKIKSLKCNMCNKEIYALLWFHDKNGFNYRSEYDCAVWKSKNNINWVLSKDKFRRNS